MENKNYIKYENFIYYSCPQSFCLGLYCLGLTVHSKSLLFLKYKIRQANKMAQPLYQVIFSSLFLRRMHAFSIIHNHFPFYAEDFDLIVFRWKLYNFSDNFLDIWYLSWWFPHRLWKDHLNIHQKVIFHIKVHTWWHQVTINRHGNCILYLW